MNLFYYGSGNPYHPSSGMDVVLREHLFETLEGSPSPLARIVFRDTVESVPPHSPFAGEGHRAFVPDRLRQGGGRGMLLHKIRHVLRGKTLMTIGYACRDAEAQFLKDLEAKDAVFVVDHLQSLTNMPLWRVLTSRHRFVYVCHDFTVRTLLDEAALSRSPLRKLSKYAQSVQILLSEWLLMAKARRVVFISSADRARFNWLCGRKSETLAPLLDHKGEAEPGAGDHAARDDLGSCAVFVGSPGFAPNAYAIEWLVGKLAPALRRTGSPARILLVGKGTERFGSPDEPTLRAAGFVDDAELRTILDDCLCSISPVIHGSGLKIKLLEAFAAGCPVVATPESLRGFEFIGPVPTIAVDDPEAAARTLTALHGEIGADGGRRGEMRRRWSEHRGKRLGRLRRTIDQAGA